MHGGERQDGTSAYASISMPNTFSMSPDYVRRFVETNRLRRVERNVFDLLTQKVARLLPSEASGLSAPGFVTTADAKRVSKVAGMRQYKGQVQLVLTSPPYLDVVNYAKQNWIRCWFLGVEADEAHEELDDNLTLTSWLEFMGLVIVQCKRMLAPRGTLVFVIGDVAKSSRSVVPIARDLLRKVLHDGAFNWVGCASDHLQIGTKTTRIWGDTKGQATAVDRILMLSEAAPDFRTARLAEAPEVGFLRRAETRFTPARLERNAHIFAGI